MNELTLRWFLPVYSVAFGFYCVVWRASRFRRQFGVNPIIPGRIDTPHGFTAFLSTLMMAAIGAVVVLFAASPDLYRTYALPFAIDSDALRAAGAGVLLAALALTAAGQIQMRESWRVGIETTAKTPIVRRGLYRWSRNPIYLGLMLVSTGMFLALPGTPMAIVVAETWTVLQILVRLEEQHLRTLHGADYEAFCAAVPRWILLK